MTAVSSDWPLLEIASQRKYRGGMAVAQTRSGGTPACNGLLRHGAIHLSRIVPAIAPVSGAWTYLGYLDDRPTHELLHEVN